MEPRVYPPRGRRRRSFTRRPLVARGPLEPTTSLDRPPTCNGDATPRGRSWRILRHLTERRSVWLLKLQWRYGPDFLEKRATERRRESPLVDMETFARTPVPRSPSYRYSHAVGALPSGVITTPPRKMERRSV